MKQKVLLFGAGEYGKSAYRRLKKHYEIVGFLDNDIEKQNKKLFGITIYNPSVINELEYSLIFITSMYEFEIMRQLTIQLEVEEDKIECIEYKDNDSTYILYIIIAIACFLWFYFR